MNRIKDGRAVAIVPATTANLGPGFDCLGMALKLYNRIEIALNPKSGVVVEVQGRCSPDQIPTDRKNLVYRAAQKVFEAAGIKAPNLVMKLDIAAPLSRGLGSSASAIAGGMAAANALLEEPLHGDRLLREMVAMEGHPDNIVPCVHGGLTAAVVVDDRIHIQRHIPTPDLRCVLLIPDYELSTSKARQAIPKKVPLKDAVFNLARIPFILERLVSGNLEGLSGLMEDKLHQPYRKGLIHSYDEIQAEAEQAGAAAVFLSGAGPTMLAICDSLRAKAVAGAMKQVLDQVDVRSEARIVEPDLEGLKVEFHATQAPAAA